MKSEEAQWSKAKQQAAQSGITLTRRKNAQHSAASHAAGYTRDEVAIH